MSPSRAKARKQHPAQVPSTKTADKSILQLCASRGKLAIELAEPKQVGPLVVTRLVSTLDGLTFPVDLSGGVSRFRHRRGSLDSLVFEANLAHLADTLTPKARQALNSPSLSLRIIPSEFGLTIGAHDQDKALAFSIYFAPTNHALQLIVANARSVGFGFHSHALALRLARSLCTDAKLTGSIITFDHALAHLAREVLLDAGARIPSCSGMCMDWDPSSEGIRFSANSASIEDAPNAETIRALELAKLAQLGDNALSADQLDVARAAYVAALESAPRHPDITLRIAEIDLLVQNNPESALASIVEAMPAVDGGIVAAEILAKIQDHNAASVTLQSAAAQEQFKPLAARMLCMAASYAPKTYEKLALLDDALAKSPTSTSIRWQRSRARLAAGHFTDAIADLGQIEAAAIGKTSRFEVCIEAGQLLIKHRLPLDARSFFEKALRYSPRSAEASSGLARAFLALGDGKRGVALLSRAAELAGSGKSTETPTPAVLIELATALAEHAVDLPTAIHYARTVPFGLPETIQARTLEGRWRHQLNDIVGASHAFALAREAASILPIQTVDIYRESLLEAAEFELDIRHDPKSAKQHAELALRACPTDPTAKRIFRRAAQSEIDSCQCKRPYSIEDPISETYQPQFESEPGGLEETEIPSDDESTIDSLTSRIRGNPNDHAAVSQLCTILERTDRLRDLLALVSGCLEESPPPAVRKDLIACRMRTLEKLIRDCRRAGRSDEAELYEMSLNEQE